MDRRRTGSPVYSRQKSGESTCSSSPGMSPAHHRSASVAVSLSSIKRTQNVAAKAAAQRLAQVMASQAAGADDDDDDDLTFHYKAPPPHSMPRLSNNNTGSIPAGISVARTTRSPSPAVISLIWCFFSVWSDLNSMWFLCFEWEIWFWSDLHTERKKFFFLERFGWKLILLICFESLFWMDFWWFWKKIWNGTSHRVGLDVCSIVVLCEKYNI